MIPFGFWIAVFFVALCIFLWFRKVWRTMWDRKRTVELAAEQLRIFRSMADELKNKDVIKRGQDIYAQAVRLYQIAFENPFNWLPAVLLGFRSISENCEDPSLNRCEATSNSDVCV